MCYCFPAYTTNTIIELRWKAQWLSVEPFYTAQLSLRSDCHKITSSGKCALFYVLLQAFQDHKKLVPILLLVEHISSFIEFHQASIWAYTKDCTSFCKQFVSSHFAMYSLAGTSKLTKNFCFEVKNKTPKHSEIEKVNCIDKISWVLLTYQVLRIFGRCHSLMENKAAKELLGYLHHQTCSTLSCSSHHLSTQC